MILDIKNVCLFWQKVKKTDTCWLWTGYIKSEFGYGFVNINYKSYYAHRISYLIHHGKDPGNLLVCHKCDVRNCIRPDHLFLGTYQDNAEDCANKNRTTIGIKNRHAKLTHEQVQQIKNESVNYTQYQLANMFDVNQSQISRILNGRTWAKSEGVNG